MAKQLPPRRRFRFRLWTVYVVTVLVVGCAYLAYEYWIVVERREWLVAHPAKGNIGTLDSLKKLSPGDRTKQPSWLRIGTLGDAPRSWVIVPRGASAAQRQEAAALFPEADILEDPPPLWQGG